MSVQKARPVNVHNRFEQYFLCQEQNNAREPKNVLSATPDRLTYYPQKL